MAKPETALSCRLAGVLGLALLWAVPAWGQDADGQTQAKDRPNVIFIMADDLGYGDLGSYGQEQIQTPHLDRMAREGTRFTSFYAGSTVCAPSRYALFTGEHTGQTPMRGNVFLKPRGDVPLPADDTTLAEVFDQAGYATGAYGKWALGLKGTSGAPHRQGLGAFFGYEDQSEAHRYYVDRLQAIEHGVTVNVDVDTTQYTHNLFTEAALAFVERNREQPFFLYLPFTIPHANLTVPSSSLEPYLDERGESRFPEPDGRGHPNATYAAMVTRLDRSVGRLLDRLDTLNLAEETIVLFTSDNGPHAAGGHRLEAFDSNGPLRGKKRDLYEGGIRVPMIAWGPGRIPAGRVSDQPWAAWDVLPTMAELLGREPPSGLGGRSMAGMLMGSRGSMDGRSDAPLYWEYLRNGRYTQALRRGRWKALRFTDADTGETHFALYDLADDLGETTNVAEEHPAVARRLKRRMQEAHARPEMKPFRILEQTDDAR
jgi:arylsulfatase A-like enzyme